MTVSESLVAFRFGVGLPLTPATPRDGPAMLAALAGPDGMADRWPIAGMAVLAPLAQEIARGKPAAKRDKTLEARLIGISDQIMELGRAALRATLARALDSHDPFRERLVWFWADHFTVVSGGRDDAARAYALVEDAIRPNLTRPFAEMLTAVTFHPAMLAYLDQTRSVGPNSREGQRKGLGLNENLARELLELHTLGVGGAYGQDDVRQLAELLTGLTYTPRRGGFEFDSRRAEPGAETVLGQSYDGKGLDPIRSALADLSRHPDTARHLAGKLAVHFLSDEPEPALVAALAKVWTDSGGDLGQVMAALVSHPAAWAPTAAKVRQPWEFVVAGLRALGVTGAEVAGWGDDALEANVLAPLRAMGQPWKAPRGPDGWPERGEAWITPQGLAARIDWAMTRPQHLRPSLPLPVDLARTALGDRISDAVQKAAERAENRAEGVGLVLSAPEFNRR